MMNVQKNINISLISDSYMFLDSLRTILSTNAKIETNFSENIFNLIRAKLSEKTTSLFVLDCRNIESEDLRTLHIYFNALRFDPVIIIFLDNFREFTRKNIHIVTPRTPLNELLHIIGISNTLINSKSEDTIDNILTKKEIEITHLITKGLNNKEIGNIQNISEKTVKAHLTNIYKKMEIKNRFELMLQMNKKY